MDVVNRHRVPRHVVDLREWQLWELPRWLPLLVMGVIVGDLAAIGGAAATVRLHARDLMLFGVLLACSAASVELTRRSRENAGLIKDVYGVWEIPIAILLPPLYALIAPIPRILLVQWRIRRTLSHRRVFSAAALGLALGAASVTFHHLAGTLNVDAPGSALRAVHWSLLAVLAVLVQSGVNKLLVGLAVKGSDPAASPWSAFLRREPLYNDLAEMCIGIVIAYAVVSNFLVAVFALPFVTLLQRSLRHAQLVSASRIDAKTGLLNAVTWQREAAVQVTRAVRTRTPLAVAMLDMDHFKLVNDTHGHLTGDLALTAVADTLRRGLRDYDLAGRFGGEEFAVLLPQTGQNEALVIAERIREQIAALTLPVRDAAEGPPLRLTVSIGIAAVTGSRLDLADLLAAADLALYQAKRSGRNMVCVIGDSPDADREALGSQP